MSTPIHMPVRRSARAISLGRDVRRRRRPRDGTVELELRLPSGLREDRLARAPDLVPCAVRAEISLDAGARRVDVRLVVDNQARDHRLRVLCETGTRSLTHRAGAAFAWLDRDTRVAPRPGWIEQPTAERALHDLVAVEGATRGLAVGVDGLREYAVLHDGRTIAITLLRAVGWLSRGDLPERKGHAGPALTTPSAQCIGVREYRYCVVPLGGEVTLPRAAREIREWLSPAWSAQGDAAPALLLFGRRRPGGPAVGPAGRPGRQRSSRACSIPRASRRPRRCASRALRSKRARSICAKAISLLATPASTSCAPRRRPMSKVAWSRPARAVRDRDLPRPLRLNEVPPSCTASSHERVTREGQTRGARPSNVAACAGPSCSPFSCSPSPGAPAAADDDPPPHFRRTTPRASLEEDAGSITLGVPSVAPGASRASSALCRPRGRSQSASASPTTTCARPSPGSRITRAPQDDPGRSPSPTARRSAPAKAASSSCRSTRRRALSPTGSASWHDCAPAPSARRDDAIHARVTLIDRAATRFGSLFSRLLPDGP